MINKMIATIQIYIHHRKNVEVDINPNISPLDMPKLIHAYTIASNWLDNNRT